MKIFRFIISILAILLLIVIYSTTVTIIKNEDFIGSFYSVNISSDIRMEICGTTTGFIDQKKDEVILTDVDSMAVVDNAIYGFSNNKYFLLSLLTKRMVYSPAPLLQYSTYSLISPMEYYKRKTRYVDIIGLIVLFAGIIFTIKKGLLKDS